MTPASYDALERHGGAKAVRFIASHTTPDDVTRRHERQCPTQQLLNTNFTNDSPRVQRGSHTQRSRRRHINVNAHVHVSAPRAPAQCGGATKAAPRRLFRWGSGPTSPPNHSPLEGHGTTQGAGSPPSPLITSVRLSSSSSSSSITIGSPRAPLRAT